MRSSGSTDGRNSGHRTHAVLSVVPPIRQPIKLELPSLVTSKKVPPIDADGQNPLSAGLSPAINAETASRLTMVSRPGKGRQDFAAAWTRVRHRGVSPYTLAENGLMDHVDQLHDRGARARGDKTSRGTRRGCPRAVPNNADPAAIERVTAGLQCGTRRSNDGYLAHRLRQLRLDPVLRDEFMSLVSAAGAEERLLRAAENKAGERRDFVTENVAQFEIPREARDDTARQRHNGQLTRRREAKEAHVRFEEEFKMLAASDADNRRQARRLKLQLAWFPFAAFSARTHVLATAVMARRAAVQLAKETKAALVVQRRMRLLIRGRAPVTPLRAILIRARFLRRVLTRVRVRLRGKQVTRIAATLRKIHHDYRTLPLFFAMRFFLKRVLLCQRFYRRRQARRLAGRVMRGLQWDRGTQIVIDELRMTAARARFAGATPTDVADGEAATRGLATLATLTTERRDDMLDGYMRGYSKRFNAELAHWLATTMPGLRWRIPPRPTGKLASRQLNPLSRDAVERRLQRYNAEMALRAAAAPPDVNRMRVLGLLRAESSADSSKSATRHGQPLYATRPVFQQLVPSGTLGTMIRVAARGDITTLPPAKGNASTSV
jgi:hypothetical protein